MDEFFKQSAYRGRVLADASEEGAFKGLKGDELRNYIRDYLRDSFDLETGAALRGEALIQARQTTFTENLMEGSAAAWLQAGAGKFPVLRFITPFIRTPVNILNQSIQHMPIAGVALKRWQGDFRAGGVRQAQAIGKQGLGAAVMTTAGYLASTGQITGSGPSEPRIRRVWLRNNSPYSLKQVNDDGTVTWVSYARYEPLASILGIAADTVELMNDEYNEASTKPIHSALFAGIMENTLNKTFTRGLHDMLVVLSEPEGYKAEAALNAFGASFVPNVFNQTNGDDILRETRTLTDAFLARSHLYNQVDPKRNVLGEPIVRALPKWDPLGLTQSDTREVDEVLQEITRVAIVNQSVAVAPARRIAGPSGIDLSHVPYVEGQSLYDRWIELTGTVEIGGKTLREKLIAVMATSSYRAAPEGFIGATGDTKGAMIRRVIAAYRSKAKGAIPELVDLIRAERRGGSDMLRDQNRVNRNSIFEDIVRNPPERAALRRRTFEDLLK